MNKKRRIVIVDGGRMTFGYLRPVIREIRKRPGLEYRLVLANCHLLDGFGRTINEIKKDKLRIDYEIHNTLAGFDRLTMVKSLGIMLLELPGVFRSLKPDIVLIAGDRGEAFVAAMVGAHLYIPVAHIQAGERSGNIDSMTRHAIARYAHIHFAANEDAAYRLLRSGEQNFRVFDVGAPQLDEFMNELATPENIIRKKLDTLDKPIILLIQHSVTEDFSNAYRQMEVTLQAVKDFPFCFVVIILNNTDAGSAMIRSAIEKNKTENMRIIEHLSRADYAGLMKISSVLVGNSSSGIIESPLFGLPVVNIGRRQADRVHSDNVLHAEHNVSNISSAITKALTEEFRQIAKDSSSVYGDGRSAKRIVDILEGLEINDKLLVKQMSY